MKNFYTKKHVLYISHCCVHGAFLSSYLSKIVPTISTTLSLYIAYCWKFLINNLLFMCYTLWLEQIGFLIEE